MIHDREVTSSLAPRQLVASLMFLAAGLTSPAMADEPPLANDAPVAWPSGPLEVVVALPRPLESGQVRGLVGRTIAYEAVPTRPEANATRTAGPRTLRIAGARLADGNRTLLVATDPHPALARYRLDALPSLPGLAAIAYDLHGVEATWTEEQAADDAPAWRGWWPTPDPASAKGLAPRSAPHERLIGLLGRPGRLTLAALVTVPPGEVTVRIESSRAVNEASLGEVAADPADLARPGPSSVDLKVSSRGEPQFLTVTLATGPDGPPLAFRVLRSSAGDKEFQPIGRDQTLLPWAPVPATSSEPAPTSVPDLAGGDPRRGEALFFGDQGKCAGCHAFRGRGTAIGPDLTEIARKGRDYLYQSIAAPSVQIDPAYLPYTVAARDGRVLAGLVRAEGPETITVTDNAAKATSLRRDEIDQIRPSGTSIMPVGLAGALGDAGLRDLVAYLLSNPSR